MCFFFGTSLLIVHFAWLSVLVFAHITKQTFLPVFMGWPCTGEDICQSARSVISRVSINSFPQPPGRNKQLCFLYNHSMLNVYRRANYGIYSPNCHLHSPPGGYTARPIRVPRLARYMPILWTSPEKLWHWIYRSILLSLGVSWKLVCFINSRCEQGEDL